MEEQPSKASAHKCLTCKKTFSQSKTQRTLELEFWLKQHLESSLVRHLKLCTRTVKPTSLRQKSCQRCAGAKAKCDLKRPVCSRCTLRGVSCVFASTPDSDSGRGDSSPSPPANHYPSSTGTSVPAGDINVTTMMDVFCDDLTSCNFPIDDLGTGDSLDLIPRSFDALTYGTSLTTTLDYPGLGDPWSSSLLSPDMTPPLVQHSMETLLRALRTWPRILCKGFQLPPMFHHTISRTAISLPLANCCTLVKMWEVSVFPPCFLSTLEP